MTPTWHPDILLVADYAFGRMAAAPALVIEAHLVRCAACRASLRLHEDLGAALLLEGSAAPIAPRRLTEMFARTISDPPGSVDLRPMPSSQPARRWLFSTGIWVERLTTPPNETWRAFRIGAPGGASLPEHRHLGAEFTCILEGEIDDGDARCGPGDFTEGGLQQPHRLRVVGPGPGIALIATERPLQWRGVLRPLGRLLGL